MEDKFFRTFEEAKSWAVECQGLGWLQEKDIDRFNQIDRRSPTTLFRNSAHRPLVIAFFGGTGVGKSTLLNRLAGHEIARTGMVRPTSREISLYMHRSFELDQLPKNFPLEKIRLDRHNSDEMRNILWIDMPDIDSTEKNNREIVLEWLPHIDGLLYVVSPERYQDEKGWRLLLSEGARHAWLFIMNQFDKADSSQLEAFSRQLWNAGFKDPIVFATDCSGIHPPTRDDFEQLKDTIENLATQHTVEQLEFRGFVARMNEVKKTVGICLKAMGSDEAIDLILQKWETIWRNAANDLDDGLQWPIQEAAQAMGTASSRYKLIKKLAKDAQQETASQSLQSTHPVLWDDWAQTRFDDALDQLTVSAGSAGIPTLPLNERLADIRPQAKKIIHAQAEQSLRRALANPGNSIQRFFLTITQICSILLPLAAIAWVAYEILDQFHDSSTSGKPYLGLNFAIHSLSMIVISWLLPWFLYRKLKPSTEKTVLSALQNGTGIGLEVIKSRIDDHLQQLLDQRIELVNSGEQIKQSCQIEVFSAGTNDNAMLARMLPENRPEPG